MLASLIEGAPDTTFLIALPSSYISLVKTDLETVTPGCRQRLFLFTSSFGASLLSPDWQINVMPYDDRLEATRRAGTRADFPQRAMRHFVADLQAVDLSLSQATSRVQSVMTALTAPLSPNRERKTDEELRSLLLRNWARCGGSSSKLLRFLRDEALVSCEQSRFRGLWLSLRAQMNS